MNEGEVQFESNFSQADTFKLKVNSKRDFTVLAADINTVGTAKRKDGSITRANYHPKSHAKVLSEWVGRPVIINHGIGDLKVVGEITRADVAEEGLLLSFRIDDDRMLEIIERNSYEGFSIGTGVNPSDPISVVDAEPMPKIMSYAPVELSVIMYPSRPACPKGVCDIISMTSCTHNEQGSTKVEKTETEVENMGENCDKCKETVLAEYISKAEHGVAMKAKDDKIAELKSQLQEREATLEEYQKQIDAVKAEKKAELISSLPEVDGVSYDEMGIDELVRLNSFYQKTKAEVEAEDGKAVETTEEKVDAPKPWLPKKGFKPGNY